jgi:hypothetical protein
MLFTVDFYKNFTDEECIAVTLVFPLSPSEPKPPGQRYRYTPLTAAFQSQANLEFSFRLFLYFLKAYAGLQRREH